LAPGAGQYGGARDVYLAMLLWDKCGSDLEKWRASLANNEESGGIEVWPEMEHPPGFDPYAVSCATPVKKTLEYLSEIKDTETLKWLFENQHQLESLSGSPLAMTGLAAAAFFELGFNAEQGEMLFLLMRLPGAAAHALEQKSVGWAKYPFFSGKLILDNDPLDLETS